MTESARMSGVFKAKRIVINSVTNPSAQRMAPLRVRVYLYQVFGLWVEKTISAEYMHTNRLTNGKYTPED